MDKFIKKIFDIFDICFNFFRPDCMQSSADIAIKSKLCYEEISKERINYHYEDFLRDCRHHNIHDDISRAVWNLSRFWMAIEGNEDYRPYLTDNLVEDFSMDYEDIELGFLDTVWIGLDLQVKDKKYQPYSSEYPAYSILEILGSLNHYYCESE